MIVRFFSDCKIFGSDEPKIHFRNIVPVSKDLKLYTEVRFQYLAKLPFYIL